VSLLETIIIAIVEGITEFLPISSTGHMIIAQKLLGVESNAFTKAFLVCIQFGAILSVVILYWKRFFQEWNFYFKLFAAFIPTAIVGLLLKSHIDAMLENVTTVAWSLLLGGIVLVFIDKFLNPKNEVPITYSKAVVVGVSQCLAMIPGVSRSAATTIGGMTQGLTRKQAAEFSFFLAVPTMAAASALSILDAMEEVPELFEGSNLFNLVVGNIVAFIVAMLAIRFFIGYLTKHGFRVFGIYRIVLGVVLLVLLAMNVPLEIID
jgi:undecaprenyl-diphosphatase